MSYSKIKSTKCTENVHVHEQLENIFKDFCSFSQLSIAYPNNYCHFLIPSVSLWVILCTWSLAFGFLEPSGIIIFFFEIFVFKHYLFYDLKL